MKHLFSLFLFFGITCSLLAQVPQAFSYQAVARDAAGICIQNSLISLRINIHDSISTGTLLYQEEFRNIETNAQGLFSIDIGKGIPQPIGSITPQFADIRWEGQNKWMEVEMDTSNGFNFILVGNQQLLSVPYAMAAGNGKEYDPIDEDESLTWYGGNGMKNGILGRGDTTANHGGLELFDNSEQVKAKLGADLRGGGSSNGYLLLYGDNGNLNIAASTSGVNNGGISLRDENGESRAFISSENQNGGAGRVVTVGPNGNCNVDISVNSGTSSLLQNRGAIRICDENGNAMVSLFVNTVGQGIIQKTVSNFVMDHPHDPTKDIVYACIEGPEAAAYERGTAKLINGEAQITFSEHFEIVANPSTMTVILTPRSPDSKGLAAFEYTETGFQVKELFQGEGNYDFDWEAKAVRKGFEDYEVIRDKMEDPGGEE